MESIHPGAVLCIYFPPDSSVCCRFCAVFKTRAVLDSSVPRATRRCDAFPAKGGAKSDHRLHLVSVFRIDRLANLQSEEGREIEARSLITITWAVLCD